MRGWCATLTGLWPFIEFSQGRLKDFNPFRIGEWVLAGIEEQAVFSIKNRRADEAFWRKCNGREGSPSRPRSPRRRHNTRDARLGLARNGESTIRDMTAAARTETAQYERCPLCGLCLP
jgi:hypothetical protein